MRTLEICWCVRYNYKANMSSASDVVDDDMKIQDHANVEPKPSFHESVEREPESKMNNDVRDEFKMKNDVRDRSKMNDVRDRSKMNDVRDRSKMNDVRDRSKMNDVRDELKMNKDDRDALKLNADVGDEFKTENDVRDNDVTGDGYDSTTDVPADRPRQRKFALQMPRVGRRLYVSGVNGITNPHILRTLHITHVLNLAVELTDTVIPRFVKVRRVALRDSDNEDLGAWLPELVQHVRDVIFGGGRVTVNCVAGMSRSVSVCLAYKVKHESVTLRDAWDELLHARPMAMPNLGFWAHLIEWEKVCRGENSVSMLPYVSGLTPDLPAYTDYARMRTSIGYMDDLLVIFSFHVFILFCQVVGIVWNRR